VLTLPHLIVSIVLDCNKSSYLFSFYLTGHFLSFVPAALVFVVFVVPSPLYRQQFLLIVASFARHFGMFT
jgi:hypothetical protein